MANVDIAPKRFQPYRLTVLTPNTYIADGAFSPVLPYEADFDLASPNHQIRRVIVSLHGSGGDAIGYYENGRAVVDAQKLVSPEVEGETLVIAPQFIEYPGEFDGALPNDLLYWERGRALGTESGNHPDNPRSYQLCSFDVMDQLLEFLSRPELLPNLEVIVLIGQSNGGRFLHRYAAVSPFEDRIARPRGVHVRYVVMGSGAYVYMDDKRWKFTSDAYLNAASDDGWQNDVVPVQDVDDACDDNNIDNSNRWNKWPWGLESLPNYPRQLGAERIREQYSSRDVIYLIGEEDWIDTEDFCAEYIQGQDTLAKTLLYYHHLQEHYGAALQHRLRVVKDVGHSGRDTMTSPEGLEEIFRPISKGVAMSTVADYIVIRDTPFEMVPGKTQAHTFNLPADIVVSGLGKRPVVAFVADPSSNASGLDCRIRLNNVEVVKVKYSGGNSHGHWEVIGHSNLRGGKTNVMQFTVVGGLGSIYFSDIILWFQKNM